MTAEEESPCKIVLAHASEWFYMGAMSHVLGFLSAEKLNIVAYCKELCDDWSKHPCLFIFDMFELVFCILGVLGWLFFGMQEMIVGALVSWVIDEVVDCLVIGKVVNDL